MDRRRFGPALGASLAVHGLILAILILGAGVTSVTNVVTPVSDAKVVYLAGGGGGGGNAPPRARAVDAARPAPPPVRPVPVPLTPTPVIDVPVETGLTSLLVAGTNPFATVAIPGPGRGPGRGRGSGDVGGDGRKPGGGVGDGPPGPGTINPTLLREEKPKYTSEAMRARIQGSVEVEAVVLENGTVGNVRVVKSLDKVFGLDQEALNAARKFLFRPGTNNGKPVRVTVKIVLEFRLQ